MGASQRRKGKAGELEVVAAVRPVFPKARRRVSGEEAQLVDQGRDLDGTAPFVIQANWSHAPPIYRKLAEAEGACAAGQIPVAVTKRTRGVWLATMRLDDWLLLARAFMAALAVSKLDGAPDPEVKL
jgi:hypothetical protein